MIPDTIKHLGAEFHHAADGVGEALQRLEHARTDRLTFLRSCSKDSTTRLAALREEVRTLEEQITKWDAEAARLESQTAGRARRYARDMGVSGTTAREVAAKQKFQALERKLWALADRIDWTTAAKNAEKGPTDDPR